jgi:hypothetical protein
MVNQAGMSDDAVKAATGKNWSEWRETLDTDGAHTMSHADIARLLSGKGVPSWWSQMVTVGYERLTGKRALGQRCDGKFSASASRTVTGDKDVALAKWLTAVDGMTEFDGAFAEEEPRLSQSENWRYWKVDLDNGSKVSVVISDKRDGKSMIGVGHERLADADSAVRAKIFWKALLASM